MGTTDNLVRVAQYKETRNILPLCCLYTPSSGKQVQVFLSIGTGVGEREQSARVNWYVESDADLSRFVLAFVADDSDVEEYIEASWTTRLSAFDALQERLRLHINV